MLLPRLQKLESHPGYLSGEPSLSLSPNLWHQRLGFIAKSSGTMATGWLPWGRVWKTGMTQRSSEEHLTHLSPPHASAQGDLAPMGRRSRGLAERKVGFCQDLGLSPPACLWKQTSPPRPGRGEGLLARSLASFFFIFFLCMWGGGVTGNSCHWLGSKTVYLSWMTAWVFRVSFASGLPFSSFYLDAMRTCSYQVLEWDSTSVHSVALVFLDKIKFVFLK